MREFFIFFFIVICFAAGCRERRPFGEPCGGDRDCASGLCVSASQSADQGVCTVSCATGDDCPRGHSCRGATNNGVVVCLPGPAVPFGDQGQAPPRGQAPPL
jgi:hypothetical protein